MKSFVAIIVVIVVVAAAVVFLQPQPDWTDIPVKTDDPLLGRGENGGLPPSPPFPPDTGDGDVTDLGTLSILSSVLFTDGSEKVFRREGIFGFVYDPSGKRIANINFQADYTPNLGTTVLGAGNTALTIAIVGPLGAWSKKIDGMEWKNVPAGQRVTPMATAWFPDTVAHLPDGGYKMTWTLRLKLSWGTGTAGDPTDVRAFDVTFPILDLSILSETTGGGGGGGGQPRPLMITKIELTPRVREVAG